MELDISVPSCIEKFPDITGESDCSITQNAFRLSSNLAGRIEF